MSDTAQRLRDWKVESNEFLPKLFIKAADELEALTLNLANAEQKVADLKAKLAQVEADAAAMREALRELKVRIAYIGMPQEPFWMDGDRKVWDWRKQCALLENALHGNKTGQALLDELATLHAKVNKLKATP